MSNGDDVLDNWDEIDEAGLNNTLHKIQAERKTHEIEQLLAESTASTSAITATTAVLPANFQPMKLLQRTQSQDNTHVSAITNKSIASSSSALKSPLDDMSASFQPVMMVLHQPVDEYQSANYTAPISSQTVKILRRPTQSSEPRNNDMRPRQPIKTLKQREQEYAEARLRILGSAKNPEDDESSNATTNNTGSSTNTTTAAATTKVNTLPKIPVTQNAYNNHQLPQQIPANAYNNSNSSYKNQRTMIAAAVQLQQQLQQEQQQSWSPIVGGIVSSSSQRVQQQESILRMPRGPDGSTGFQMRR